DHGPGRYGVREVPRLLVGSGRCDPFRGALERPGRGQDRRSLTQPYHFEPVVTKRLFEMIFNGGLQLLAGGRRYRVAGLPNEGHPRATTLALALNCIVPHEPEAPPEGREGRSPQLSPTLQDS